MPPRQTGRGASCTRIWRSGRWQPSSLHVRMTAKPSRVLIIGPAPVALGHAAPLLARGFVYDAAGADDLAQEGVTARVMVLAGRVADGRQAICSANGGPRNDFLAVPGGAAFEV